MINATETLSQEFTFKLIDILNKNDTQAIIIIDNTDNNENFLNNLSHVGNAVIIGPPGKDNSCRWVDISQCDYIQFLLSRLFPEMSIYEQTNSCSLFSTLLWKEIWSGKTVRHSFEKATAMLNHCLPDTITPTYIQNIPGALSLPIKVGVGVQLDVGHVIPKLILNIKNAKSLQPVSPVYISTGSSFFEDADETGTYMLSVMASEGMTITIMANGYLPVYTHTSIQNGEVNIINIAMIPGIGEIPADVNRDISLSYSPDDVDTVSCFISVINTISEY